MLGKVHKNDKISVAKIPEENVKKIIEKIIFYYKQGNTVRAEKLGYAFYEMLPLKIKKIVKLSSFLNGSMFELDHNILTGESYIDLLLAKRLIFDGELEKFKNICLTVLKKSKDPLSILYSLKELKVFEYGKIKELIPKYILVDTNTLRTKYLSLFLQEKYSEAIEVMSKFFSVNPHPEILIDLLDFWFYTNQPVELLNLCVSMTKENKHNFYVDYMIAFSLYSLSKINDAILVLERLHELFPKNSNILYNLANCHYRAKNYEKAIKYLEKIETRKSIEDFLSGVCNFCISNYKKAEEDFLKSSHDENLKFFSLYNLSISEFYQGKKSEAIENILKFRNSLSSDYYGITRLNKVLSLMRRKSRKIPLLIKWFIAVISLAGLCGIVLYYLDFFEIKNIVTNLLDSLIELVKFYFKR